MSLSPITATISASVGAAPASNRPDDVLVVQKLLNKAGAGISEDRRCGPGTIGAIKEYQRHFLPNPDGRVDPGGATWKRLVEGKVAVKKQAFVLLPQISGVGYYPYSPMERQYGTSPCIQALRDIATQLKSSLKVEVGIGDISLRAGGHMSPHQSHQHGRNVDIRPLRKDGKNLPVTIHDPNYSRESTKLLVQSLRAHRNVVGILFNDTAIAGVTAHAGHDNHLHVTFKE